MGKSFLPIRILHIQSCSADFDEIWCWGVHDTLLDSYRSNVTWNSRRS